MNNEALTYSEMINPAQLILIRQAARRLSVNPEQACKEVMGCTVLDLSKAAADRFVKLLWKLEEPTA